MSKLARKIDRLIQRTEIFVPGYVLRTIRDYLRERESDRLADPTFASQVRHFWSKFHTVNRSGTQDQLSDLGEIFSASEGLRESFLLNLIEDSCESYPEGSWMKRTEQCLYAHYYRIARDHNSDKQNYKNIDSSNRSRDEVRRGHSADR
jgi:hypothetical protein